MAKSPGGVQDTAGTGNPYVLRFLLSDGFSTVNSVMQKKVLESAGFSAFEEDGREVGFEDLMIIRTKKIDVTSLKSNKIVIFQEPPEIIYKSIKDRIGEPEDVKKRQKEEFNGSEEASVAIPEKVFRDNKVLASDPPKNVPTKQVSVSTDQKETAETSNSQDAPKSKSKSPLQKAQTPKK